jgi:hypothetical protein
MVSAFHPVARIATSRFGGGEGLSLRACRAVGQRTAATADRIAPRTLIVKSLNSTPVAARPPSRLRSRPFVSNPCDPGRVSRRCADESTRRKHLRS